MTENKETLPSFIFLYGPPGSGKTTVGKLLARALNLPFWDLDSEIEKSSGRTVAEIFAREGEQIFREHERVVLGEVLKTGKGVVALGGGALLDAQNRERVEAAGLVLCLTAPFATLLSRVLHPGIDRPLLGTDAETIGVKLETLLERRAGHYQSFAYQLDTGELEPQTAAWEAQIRLGWFRVHGMAREYEVLVRNGVLNLAGLAFRRSGLGNPVALITDEHIAPRYAPQIRAALQDAGYTARLIVLPSGEANKTPATLSQIWSGLVEAGIERGSCVAALGGGVVGDLAGFAAATFLRGVHWAVLPTSLLAMCDAAIGGKTGADLPQGKNLIGAFHPPSLVLIDPCTLATLPAAELHSGLAEVVKAGIIGDPVLFMLCEQGLPALKTNWAEVVSRAAAVKIKVIQTDPFEKDARASLNLGHTIGHALEWASNYQLKHGEAVAIGMAVAARLAEKLGVATPGLEERITSALNNLALPTHIPAHITPDMLLSAIRVDKKRAAGKARFVLPTRIGEVRYGMIIEEQLLCEVISSCMDQT